MPIPFAEDGVALSQMVPSSGRTNRLKFSPEKAGWLDGIEKQPEAILVFEDNGPAVRSLVK